MKNDRPLREGGLSPRIHQRTRTAFLGSNARDVWVRLPRMKRGILVVATVALLSIGIGFFSMRGRRDVSLDGTLQWGFEESAFFPNGDCSKKPFWWEWPNSHDNDLTARWKELGQPAALHVIARGDLSAFGLHGHLGAYHREFQPVVIVSAGPAPRCQWSWSRK